MFKGLKHIVVPSKNKTLQVTPRPDLRHTQDFFAPTPKSTPLRSPVYALSLAGV